MSRRPVLLVLLVLAAAPAAAQLPDLVLDQSFMNLRFDMLSFAPSACELQPTDRCVDGPGARKLLRFGVFAVNQGGDLVLGTPAPGDPMWVYSACHNHFHFDTFAHYALIATDGSGASYEGQKRSFCVEDSLAARPGAATQRKFCCDRSCNDVQGVQSGWGDLYPDTLPCQWIDITAVPPGDYRLCIELNFSRALVESDYGNDGACLPVHIAAPDPRFGPPTIRVTAPHRGARLRAGRNVTIHWTERGRGERRFQELYLSRDDGETWEFVTNALTPTQRRFRWLVPPTLTAGRARLRVVTCVRNPPNDPGAGALQCGNGQSGRFRVVSQYLQSNRTTSCCGDRKASPVMRGGSASGSSRRCGRRSSAALSAVRASSLARW